MALDGGTTSYNAVFIDTNLNTHLALIVSSSDTVSDLKNKILLEHPACFPEIGEIKIHALKVKRRGNFYHLSDLMFMKSVFPGVKKNWFMSIDASRVEDHKDNPSFVNGVVAHGITISGSADGIKLLTDGQSNLFNKAGCLLLPQDEHDQGAIQNVAADDQTDLDIPKGDEHRKDMSGDANNSPDAHIQEKYDQYNEENEAQRKQIGDGDGNSIIDTGSVLPEGAVETGSHTKQRKRKKKTKSAVDGLVLKESSLRESGKSESWKNIRITENSLDKEGEVVSHDDELPPVQMGNQNVSSGPGMNESFDVIKRSESLARSTEVQNAENEDPGENIEHVNDACENNIVKNLQCDVEDISQSDRAAKKRRKRDKQKGDENPVKENKTFISDNNKETLGHPAISQHSIKDKTPNKLSTEDLEGIHLQSVRGNSEKKKRKKKSLDQVNNEEISAASSPRKVLGEEPDAASAPEKLVEAVPISEPCAVSWKEKHCDPVHDTEKDIGVFRDENTAVGGYQKPGSGQTDRVEEERESARKICSKPMPKERCKLSIPDEMDMESKEVTSKFLQVSETADSRKSSKKSRKSKKNKDLGSGTQSTLDTDHVEGFMGDISTETQHAIRREHSSDKGTKEESNMPSKERKEVLEGDMESTSILATDREINDVIQNVVESVNKITKAQVNAESMDGKSRKKRKKKRGADAKNLLEIQLENVNACHTGPRTDNAGQVYSSEILGCDKDAMVKKGPLNTQLNSVNGESFQISPLKDRNIRNVLDDNSGKTGGLGEASNLMKGFCEINSVNFNDYFVPGQHHHEIVTSGEVLADKATKLEGTDSEMKSGKKNKKLDVHLHGSSADLQSLLRLKENHGIETEHQQADNSSNKELEGSFSNAMYENNKPSNITGSSVKAIASNKSDIPNSNLEENSGFIAVKSSGAITCPKTSEEAVTASNSHLENTKNTISQNKRANEHQSSQEHKHVENQKAPVTNIGKAGNGLERDYKLMGSSGLAFKDVSHVASADVCEDGHDSSDATTRTPSNTSLSSGYSDGESTAEFNSSQNGSFSLRRKEGGDKNMAKIRSSGLSLDTILRNSSRYKKAKLAASQSQMEDSESQPVDVVPDSQANP